MQLKVIQGVPFVIINSMAFEGDGCFLCKTALQELDRLQEVQAVYAITIPLGYYPSHPKLQSLSHHPTITLSHCHIIHCKTVTT